MNEDDNIIRVHSTSWKGLSCPLGKVLTYKNLMYLLNLQFYCITTSYQMGN